MPSDDTDFIEQDEFVTPEVDDSNSTDSTDSPDFEEIEVPTGRGRRSGKKSDMGQAVVGFLSMAYFKLLFAIFMIFLFVSSDVFIDKVLGYISGASEHRSPTTKGVMIQALIMVILVMFIDLLLRMGFP
jgi:hypothetical protein